MALASLALLIFKAALAILAAYRLARMVALEEGPFSLFQEIRGRIDYKQQTWVGRGINCPLCVGFYVSLLAAFVVAWSSGIGWEWALGLWLPIAGGQTYLQKNEGLGL